MAGAFLVFAVEGIGCLLMALPLALPLAVLGGVVGHFMARHHRAPLLKGCGLRGDVERQSMRLVPRSVRHCEFTTGAPHLKGFFQTTRGEFRLVPLPGGRTRLEGRTWYTLRMHPQGYWTILADLIVHRIHDRVLDHIRRDAE